ncbi:hypothetical protein KUTeg_017919 [Tegillarca granosa]|uniref:Uncharacterized protein n=1 Tax=Tegillarca granosa TaxID=220873 RepID=A0ABQ9EIT5_TEGGR|nr:hypothetical protein KUTeg_017919 [Tegillarca granosa]
MGPCFLSSLRYFQGKVEAIYTRFLQLLKDNRQAEPDTAPTNYESTTVCHISDNDEVQKLVRQCCSSPFDSSASVEDVFW